VTVSKDSPAVVVARAHMEAWNNHDFDTARAGLADNVEVTAMSTKPGLPGTNLTGIDDYMRGLHTFADPIVPGSLRVLASIGDEHNALLMVTVEADFGGGATAMPVTMWSGPNTSSLIASACLTCRSASGYWPRMNDTCASMLSV
jgi:SnoaL-like domain